MDSTVDVVVNGVVDGVVLKIDKHKLTFKVTQR